MQTNEELIYTASKGGWLPSLAFTYYVKHRYKNGSIYDYSSRVLGDKIGMSHSVVANHVSVLREKGLCKVYGSNLTFVSTKAVYKCTIHIVDEDTIKDIEKKLLLKLLEKNLRSQQYIIDKKHEARLGVKKAETNSSMTIKEVKGLYSHANQALLGSALNRLLTMTDLALSKLLSVSVRTASSIKKWWRKNKLIEYNSGYQRLTKYYKGFQLAPNQFFFNGYVYQGMATEYLLRPLK